MSSQGLESISNQHLVQSIEEYNSRIPPTEAITIEAVFHAPCRQKDLSCKLEDSQFNELFANSSLPDRARLLSVSSPHAGAWLSVIPSPGLNLHLDPLEFQTAIQWWLGMSVSQRTICPFCPAHSLDSLGHHALTCKHGGDVVTRHNRLRVVYVESC